MASKLPAYILKRNTLVAGGANRIGQCSEITIPVLEKTMEAMRNAGMIKPRMIDLGLEATELAFKETALDPAMMALFLGNGPAQDIIAYGYLESEDGREHSARIEMVCDMTKMDFGNWAEGSKAENEFSATVHSYRFFIDDEEILAVDDFSLRVRGVEHQPGARRALRLV